MYGLIVGLQFLVSHRELRQVLVGPPVCHVPVTVVLRALAVEAVGDLMGDGGAQLREHLLVGHLRVVDVTSGICPAYGDAVGRPVVGAVRGLGRKSPERLVGPPREPPHLLGQLVCLDGLVGIPVGPAVLG